jgi:hypothetical protein
MLTAAFGVGTVLLLALLGSRLFSREVGFIAALFLAIAYGHVRESHFATTDVPLLFFVTASVAAGAEARLRGGLAFSESRPGSRVWQPRRSIPAFSRSAPFSSSERVFLAFPLEKNYASSSSPAFFFSAPLLRVALRPPSMRKARASLSVVRSFLRRCRGHRHPLRSIFVRGDRASLSRRGGLRHESLRT